jgi:hypothetical protein
MKNNELFFINEENSKPIIYNNKKEVVNISDGDEFNAFLSNTEIINVNNELVDDLHNLIYEQVGDDYLNNYFKVEEKLKKLVPFGFYHQPFLVNIAKKFINQTEPVVILNNPILKFFELIDYASNKIKEKTTSGYGNISMPDIIINFIEQSLFAIKYKENIDKQILYYFYMINATLPKEERLENEDFYKFYFEWLGKETDLNNETLKYVLMYPNLIDYMNNILNFLKGN